jgi:hypothetical protein
VGTNYYWREKTCECCGRHDELHIGKSSHGWVFAWHGSRLNPDDEYSYEDPAVKRLGIPLDTAQRWTDFLRATDGSVRNEYGNTVTVDDFLALVEKKRGGINRLSSEADLHRSRRHLPVDEVTDPLGDDVCFYEFS